MPDVQRGRVEGLESTLDWVGMSNIAQPLLVRDGDTEHRVRSQVQVFVDLGDPEAKGIHMSRLYLILDEHAETRPLTVAGLKLLLASLLESHRGLSQRVYIDFRFDTLLRRPALVSDNSGWNAYPTTIRGVLEDGEISIELHLEVRYSSTCPCSAALARQLIQEQFESDFGANGTVKASEIKAWLGSENGIVATPHSQRSVAHLRAKLRDDLTAFPLTALVDALEERLATPVQTAVKREDEQEFARLNGQNLMFIEDAGRRLKSLLAADDQLLDFWVRVEHHESLHAHDAVGVFVKGVEGGFAPVP
ncbi:MAG: GTP cyclohydrolase FolE2 [Pseudomonadota bacterium]